MVILLDVVAFASGFPESPFFYSTMLREAKFAAFAKTRIVAPVAAFR
jgi:hypothetical protein